MKISVEAIGVSPQGSKGKEIWLVGASGSNGMRISAELLRATSDSEWQIKEEKAIGLGSCLVAEQGKIAWDMVDTRVVLTFLAHEWSGLACIKVGEISRIVNLFRARSAESVEVLCTNSFILLPDDLNHKSAELDGLSDISEDAVVAIASPKWRGVYSATKKIFPFVLACPHDATKSPSEMSSDDVAKVAERVLNIPAKTWIVSGGDIEFLNIARVVREQDKSKRFFLLFHGAFLALGMTLDRAILMAWVKAARDGYIEGILNVKRGMDQLCGALGVRSVFLPLQYPAIIRPQMQSLTCKQLDRSQLGVWLSRAEDTRKICPALPYAMYQLRNEITLNGSGINWDILSLMNKLEIRLGNVSTNPIPQAQLQKIMQEMDLNIYLTSSECSPMLPLESLALGVPCLMGPVTYYFEDNCYLKERLVVSNISDPRSIQLSIKRALAERSDILDAYTAYQESHAGETQSVLFNFLKVAD